MCFISLNSFADTVAQQNSERADGLDDFSSLSAEKIVSELNDIIHKLRIIWTKIKDYSLEELKTLIKCETRVCVIEVSLCNIKTIITLVNLMIMPQNR